MTKTTIPYHAPYFDAKTGRKGEITFHHPDFFVVMFSNRKTDISYVINAETPEVATKLAHEVHNELKREMPTNAKTLTTHFSHSMVPYLGLNAYASYVGQTPDGKEVLSFRQNELMKNGRSALVRFNALKAIMEMVSDKMKVGFLDAPLTFVSPVFVSRVLQATVTGPDRSVKSHTLLPVRARPLSPEN